MLFYIPSRKQIPCLNYLSTFRISIPLSIFLCISVSFHSVCILILELWTCICTFSIITVLLKIYSLKSGVIILKSSQVIVCEPARLRIAYCLSVHNSLSCPPHHYFNLSLWPSDTLQVYYLSDPLPDKQSAEHRLFYAWIL